MITKYGKRTSSGIEKTATMSEYYRPPTSKGMQIMSLQCASCNNIILQNVNWNRVEHVSKIVTLPHASMSRGSPRRTTAARDCQLQIGPWLCSASQCLRVFGSLQQRVAQDDITRHPVVSDENHNQTTLRCCEWLAGIPDGHPGM